MHILSKYFAAATLCMALAFSSFGQNLNFPTVVRDGNLYYVYQVQQAEGFYSITRKFNVSQEHIIKVNPDATNGLKKGQTLYIPVSADSADNISTKATTVSIQDNTTSPQTATSDKYFIHTIQPGETLSSIARTYNITVKDIEAANPGLASYLRVGFPVRIPQPSQQGNASTADAGANGNYIYHTIEPKETLYSLAQKYNVTMQEIMDANPGLNESTFAVGKVVRIKNAQAPAQTVTTTETVKYQTYKVKKKNETLYSISQKFDIPLENLIAANPNVTEIKKGDEIIIPMVEQTTTQNSKPVQDLNEMYSILSEPTQIVKEGPLNVVVMLPFYLNDHTGKNKEQYRYIEFYEGFLIALDSIKSQGGSYEIRTYDTETKNIDDLLRTDALANADLIIGPARNQDIDKVARFAKEKGINMVNPFTFDSEAVDSNPNIFQINTPNSYLLPETAAEFVNMFHDQNIVLIRDKNATEAPKEFIGVLTQELDQKNKKYYTFDYGDSGELLKVDSLLNLQGPTVFVPVVSNKAIIGDILPQLHYMHLNNPNIQISLFGYPEWQTYTEDFIRYFYELNTYFYTRIYVNPFADSTREFYERYKFWYGKDLIPGYPKYGLLGFDTGMFFLGMANKYGKNFNNHIEMIPSQSIQTAMCFNRVNNWSGFVNRCLYIVNFRPNSTINKIEVK